MCVCVSHTNSVTGGGRFQEINYRAQLVTDGLTIKLCGKKKTEEANKMEKVRSEERMKVK